MSLLHHSVAQRLRAILATNALGVAVISEPDVQTPRESILIDFPVQTDFDFPHFKGGGAPQPIRFNELEFRIGIEAHSPGLSAIDTQARWVAIGSAVLDLVRANPTLQTGYSAIVGLLGVSGVGSVRGPFTGRLPDNTGWSCLGDILIPIRTNVC
jgi:hypothetical protein